MMMMMMIIIIIIIITIIIIIIKKLVTNSMAYGMRRLNAAFTRLSNNPYPEPNRPN